MSLRADVAQLVEHSLGKGEVTSSILVISSRNKGAQGTVHSGQLSMGRAGDEASMGTKKLITDHCPLITSFRGSNSVVESQPSKLLVAGSNPVSRSRIGTVGFSIARCQISKAKRARAELS